MHIRIVAHGYPDDLEELRKHLDYKLYKWRKSNGHIGITRTRVRRTELWDICFAKESKEQFLSHLKNYNVFDGLKWKLNRLLFQVLCIPLGMKNINMDRVKPSDEIPEKIPQVDIIVIGQIKDKHSGGIELY